MIERLLACDLDGTLLGDSVSLRGLNQALLKHRKRWAIAYVTGRRLETTLPLVASGELLEPDFVVTGVGTGIFRGPDFQADPSWARALVASWDRQRVLQVAASFPQLTAQPEEEQVPAKCSYFLDGSLADQVVPSLEAALYRQQTGARVIYSSRRDLDIVPTEAGKGNAVRYLARCLNLDLERVVTCGDSGNDRAMLRLGCPAVVVANAQPELATWSHPNVYRAQEACAAGVHEGLRFHGWLP